MSEEIMVIGKSALRKLIREELEDFFAAMDLLGKSNQPIPISTHEKLISLEEVRKIVGCSAPKLLDLRKANRFPPEIRIGKSVFFDRQMFYDFLDKGGTKQGIVS